MKLTLLVGLPRSGKTTVARSMGVPIVNPDSVRLGLHGQTFVAKAEPFVWPIAYLMADALFLAGHEHVVVDATNVSTKRRDEWMKRFPQAEIELRILDTSPQICARRALADKRADLLPIIERMAAEWDLPRPESWSDQLELGELTNDVMHVTEVR